MTEKSSTNASHPDLETLRAAGVHHETCCGNVAWRFHLCQYHQGFADGWDTAIERIMQTAVPAKQPMDERQRQEAQSFAASPERVIPQEFPKSDD